MTQTLDNDAVESAINALESVVDALESVLDALESVSVYVSYTHRIEGLEISYFPPRTETLSSS